MEASMILRLLIGTIVAISFAMPAFPDSMPVAMAAMPDGVIIISGEYYKRGEGAERRDEEGYWIWRLDENGAQIWVREFKSDQQEDPCSLITLGQDRLMLLGKRFVNGSGFLPFLQAIGSDGEIENRINIAAPGISNHFIGVDNDLFLIGGTSDEAPEKRGIRGADWDAWLLCVRADGTIVWQRWLDRKQDEEIYALAMGENGHVFCLADSGQLDKFGFGKAAIWLFEVDAAGTLVRELALGEGRIGAKSGDGLLVRRPNQLLAVFSGLHSSVDTGNLPFTFPARIVSATPRLQRQWNVELRANHFIGTPVIAAVDSGGYVAASSGGEMPLLTPLSAEGKLGPAMEGEKWPFHASVNIVAILVNKQVVYVAGTVSNIMSRDDDRRKTFLACFDLEKKSLVWQKTYE
jgi:hypothetical protein